METFIRSNYLYNAFLLKDTGSLEKIDTKVYRQLFKAVLKNKDKGVSKGVILRLTALFQICSMYPKL